jgi:hypothetical protein
VSAPIILMDVDKTIYNLKYNLTIEADLFRAGISAAISKGIDLGLNSDSALQTLQDLGSLYGLQGPIIAERGAVLCLKGVVTYPVQTTAVFSELFAEVFSALGAENLRSQYFVLSGNVNWLANSLPCPDELLWESWEGRIAVLLNSLRRRSFSCFVRRFVGGKWVKEELALTEIRDVLTKVVKVPEGFWPDCDVDFNPQYGVCILHHKDTQKRVAVDSLLAYAGDRPIYMVGDSIADWLDHERVIQCAVGNASQEYKNHCQLIAGQEFTAGVLELIHLISR